MKPLSESVLHAFLEQCPSDTKAQLLSLMPQEQKESFSKNSVNPFDAKQFQVQVDGLIDEVHYSWLLTILNSFAKKDISFFLLCMDKEKQEKIKKQIPNLRLPKTPLSNAGICFFKNHLTKSLLPQDFLLIPSSELPSSPRNDLLKLSKKELVCLIDLLALYDLRAEIKTIVDKNILNNIENALSKDQQIFLHKIREYKEPLSLPKMHLENWDGDHKIFFSILHKRGLNRLAYGLANENPSLIWHITHRLDIGRGGVFIKKVEETKPQEEIQNIIEENITFTLDYLTQQKEGKR